MIGRVYILNHEHTFGFSYNSWDINTCLASWIPILLVIFNVSPRYGTNLEAMPFHTPRGRRYRPEINKQKIGFLVVVAIPNYVMVD